MALILDGDGSISGIDQGIAISGLTTITGDIHLTQFIDHVGDENSRFGFPANDTFSVETAGTERIRVTSNGNVSIGDQASPTHRLYIENDQGGATGRIGVDCNVSSGYGCTIMQTDDGLEFSVNSNFAHFIVNSGLGASESFRITAAGNVGIGTDIPCATLDVGGIRQPATGRGAVAIKAQATDVALPFANIYLEEPDGGEGYYLSVNSVGDLDFVNSGNTTVLTLADDDNVGIGSTIPRASLDVPGGGATRLVLVENDQLTSTGNVYTGIPAWVTKITICFYRMSVGSTNNPGVRLGTSGGLIETNYDSNSTNETGSTDGTSTNKFVILNSSASHNLSGRMVIEKLSSSVYVETHDMAEEGSATTRQGGGYLDSVSGTIDRIAVTVTNTTFDSDSRVTIYCE